jgi:hypothetical protein
VGNLWLDLGREDQAVGFFSGPARGGAPGWLLCGLALPPRWEITT